MWQTQILIKHSFIFKFSEGIKKYNSVAKVKRTQMVQWLSDTGGTKHTGVLILQAFYIVSNRLTHSASVTFT